MSQVSYTLGVLGAGSYGTALAIASARQGNITCLWGRNHTDIARFTQTRQNDNYLPNITFPSALALSSDLDHIIQSSQHLLIVVPSHNFKQLLLQIAPKLSSTQGIIWATKGLEPDTGIFLQQTAEEILGVHRSYAVLSGPTFAKELAKGLPTAITLAATNFEYGQKLVQLFHDDQGFRVYYNDDMKGVQLGGAVKNVIAIAAGIADGLGFGANARTALITRGIAEISRLGYTLGCKQETFMGMACLGDLILTCTDNQSRNRRFGLALGQGQSVDTAIAQIGQVVEGYRNTKEVHLLAERQGVELPITEAVYQIIFQQKSIKQAAKDLLGRAPKSESI